jgi:hypothetical protein
MEVIVMGTEFQFCMMKRILEMGDGDACTNVNEINAN